MSAAEKVTYAHLDGVRVFKQENADGLVSRIRLGWHRPTPQAYPEPEIRFFVPQNGPSNINDVAKKIGVTSRVVSETGGHEVRVTGLDKILTSLQSAFQANAGGEVGVTSLEMAEAIVEKAKEVYSPPTLAF